MYKLISFLFLLLPLNAKAETIEYWSCKQSHKLSETMFGVNEYTTRYNFESKTSIQEGRVIITDKSKKSEINYTIEFDYTEVENNSKSIVRDVKSKIVQDELQLFSGDAFRGLPNVGDIVQGKFKMLDNNTKHLSFEGGTVVECLKSLSS
ncbi:hypothetical protein [Thalassotalea litorea]|uniref:hypothetical protein n=1 Tax=Thalassotalea litorea TaxID=2020715 RepID=UPI003735BD45